MTKRTLPRECYVPQESTKIKDKRSSAIAYLHMNFRDQPAAAVFAGKRAKPDSHYCFKSVEQRQEYVTKFFVSVQKREQEKKDRRAERKNETHTLKVNDILYASWGYDQTNIDFYQVVEVVSNKTVRIRQIGKRSVEGSGESNGMSDQVVAARGQFLEGYDVLTKRANRNNYVGIASYANAGPWDGKPLYRSWYH